MNDQQSELGCPLPFAPKDKILLAHGGGGRYTQQLIREIFLKSFKNSFLAKEHDASVLPSCNSKMAMTTDSYVVRPLFFPGGDIGKLSIFGTVNDLAMSGARPLYISVGFILEEGFAIDKLQRIAQSMQDAAEQCGVQIVTGDTKVVERGKGDEIFINTSGIGSISHSLAIEPKSIQPGDAVLLSGDVGRHGMAIMAAREGLQFETTVESDCAPLAAMVMDLLESEIEVHCLRDLTRGGLATALNEIATTSGLAIEIEENRIPVNIEVRGACEMLGLDPLYSANEGRMVVIVPEKEVRRTLEILSRHEAGAQACEIGKVENIGKSRLSLKSSFGPRRILDLQSGEQLPRIC